MKLIIDKVEYWIKNDTVLPSNFDSMYKGKKLDYIYQNKLLHREDGPAHINSFGTKHWYLNGKRHREDGPAVIFSDRTKWWYLNDIKVDEKIYKKIENSTKEELLMYAVLPKYKDYLSLIEYRLNII